MELRSIRSAVISLALATTLGVAAGHATPEEIPRDKVVHPLMTGVSNPEVIPETRRYLVYPERWRSSHLGARVILQAAIDKWGRASGIQVLKTEVQVETDCHPSGGETKSNGSQTAPAPPEAGGDFESAAVAAVKQWKFRPGTMNGVPVAVYHSLIIEFTSCPSSPKAQSRPSP